MSFGVANTSTESLLQALERHCTERPDATFCHFWSGYTREDISFRQLKGRAGAYANLYGESGLRAGNIVLIMLKHSPDMYYAFIGAMLCGCIPSMMPFPSVKQDPVKYSDLIAGRQYRTHYAEAFARYVLCVYRCDVMRLYTFDDAVPIGETGSGQILGISQATFRAHGSVPVRVP